MIESRKFDAAGGIRTREPEIKEHRLTWPLNQLDNWDSPRFLWDIVVHIGIFMIKCIVIVYNRDELGL